MDKIYKWTRASANNLPEHNVDVFFEIDGQKHIGFFDVKRNKFYSARDGYLEQPISQFNFLKEVQPSLKEDEWKAKAEKWDALEDKISKFYFNDDGEEKEDDDGGDLCDIGEAAAMAFGFL